jgi:hypothetical protein
LNDHKVNMPMVNSIVNIIRTKEPYIILWHQTKNGMPTEEVIY